METISCHNNNTNNCGSNCPNFLLCSLLKTEKHINEIESRLTNVFLSVNTLLEISTPIDEKLNSLENRIANKEDIIEEFNNTFRQIDELKELIIENNEEILSILKQHTNTLNELKRRLVVVEKSIRT